MAVLGTPQPTHTHGCHTPSSMGRKDAESDAATEPLLSSYLYASILSHATFDRSLAFVLANRMANSTMLPTQLFDIFLVRPFSTEGVGHWGVRPEGVRVWVCGGGGGGR